MSDSQPVMVTSKPWYMSRTMWVNLTLAIVGLAVYLLTAIQTGQLQNPFDIEPDTLAFWVGVLNMILRWLTTEPITGTGGQ